eukprot:CAMPEP_0176347854 /NCGR_PEP_ID=MMETSP0126-20121128/7407_1 /TAXON_ID=141414 ORGANISM="Strombidinopsis acuminatum, Strain SPMC142" /NCGR_SAMPLE_ID=MMETSP0126 /ASSEMBLY_ACC=CAM_ASM_000229 /LENGTH=56 /DNA_ID=CAMNT_0017696313 /DNA_START=4020 /DNA_END=4190 /DNA_ORIENTATION=-
MTTEEELIKQDLEELIQANNGEDIEFEFYYQGRLLDTKTSLYEICNQDKKGLNIDQ